MNARWGSFYVSTTDTLEAAYVRPRHDGYIAFQTDASAMLRQGIATREPHAALLGRLQTRYALSRARGGER